MEHRPEREVAVFVAILVEKYLQVMGIAIMQKIQRQKVRRVGRAADPLRERSLRKALTSNSLNRWIFYTMTSHVNGLYVLTLLYNFVRHDSRLLCEFGLAT